MMLFEYGDHTYIWPMNHAKYIETLSNFIGKCGHQIVKNKKKKSSCIIN